MTIQEASIFLENLAVKATDKSEIKIYEKFLHILSKLKERTFSEEEIKLIENKLDDLKLDSNPKNPKKYFKQALTEFEKYLKETFSLTPKGYYTNRYMGLGLSFGILFGIAILSNLEHSLGISLGLIGGMLVGSIMGKQKDTQAKEAGNVF
ncbi:hypothetical protein Q4553_01295 [Tenacibaculum soleae]|uniref:hypothetical protein n=1 Tax=Tenacibaculum soleae TaxID=447689 RepID=UPI0026E4649E|nr:hypothetical protein [Tenacibaculum soleae]MDO6743200.1 hypothetical protein [Tenacibaculum soleae]